MYCRNHLLLGDLNFKIIKIVKVVGTKYVWAYVDNDYGLSENLEWPMFDFILCSKHSASVHVIERGLVLLLLL